jgi:DNA-binding transcriptional regulator YbjK
MEDVIAYLKKLQGLLERSVNGNQQTHNLLSSINDSSKRLEQLLERVAVATEASQTSNQHMEQQLEPIIASNQHIEEMMEHIILMYNQISKEVIARKR